MFPLPREIVVPDYVVLAYFDDAIEHIVTRVRRPPEEFKDHVQQSQDTLPADRRKDNQAGMHVDASDQSTEVTCVHCNQDPVFVHASIQDGVIVVAATTNVERMERVKSQLIEAPRERW
jgi:hypothetical protein